ncbi:hypothetical protein Dimus_032123 [Dionaea muscipula]
MIRSFKANQSNGSKTSKLAHNGNFNSTKTVQRKSPRKINGKECNQEVQCESTKIFPRKNVESQMINSDISRDATLDGRCSTISTRKPLPSLKSRNIGGAQDNLVAKKVVSRARDDDDEGIREGQGNTIVNGVVASNKGNVTWIFFFASFLMQRVML